MLKEGVQHRFSETDFERNKFFLFILIRWYPISKSPSQQLLLQIFVLLSPPNITNLTSILAYQLPSKLSVKV
ncbi:hypothetical protein D0Y65_002087 [Glycine soja]|uniref:Uncharacterized protein n=1 Tax=Glycine soja TaxID=3848 RepID=A0A445M5N0_GLYSO|nr:hypothetical protein D0Y65_002087 [Glycine soja]